MTRNLPTADHALTDAEISERFGPLFAEFSAALRADPLLLVEMAERVAVSKRALERNAESRREQAEVIHALRAEGLTFAQIATRVGTSAATVGRVLRPSDADTPAREHP